MGTVAEQVTEVLPTVDDDISDFDGMSHYVRADYLIKQGGGVQVALCGKKWIPRTIADAQNYPTCKTCEDLFGLIQAMG